MDTVKGKSWLTGTSPLLLFPTRSVGCSLSKQLQYTVTYEILFLSIKEPERCTTDNVIFVFVCRDLIECENGQFVQKSRSRRRAGGFDFSNIASSGAGAVSAAVVSAGAGAGGAPGYVIGSGAMIGASGGASGASGASGGAGATAANANVSLTVCYF